MELNNFTNWNDYDEFSFGKFITKRRKELGMSLRQMALSLGMSAVYLSDIEHGARKPSEKYMDNFVMCLHITETELNDFYTMANVSKGRYFEFKDYLDENYYARTFLRLAKEKELSDDEWQNIINQIK